MQKTKLQLPEIKLIGLTIRTNNLAEQNPTQAKISSLVQKYFSNTFYDKIPNRKKPGVTYNAYTNYESDVNGDYTYFIGEEVETFDNVISPFEKLIIPTQYYAKFTNGPDKMPDVCIKAWQQIWALNPEELENKRNYITDFEIYDKRSRDPENVILDIFIGIKKE